MYGRICLDKYGFWRMHNNNGVVCDMFSWPLVCWQRVPAFCVHVCRGLLFGCGGCRDVRGHERIVHFLHGRQFVRRQRRSASCLYMYCGVRLDKRDIERVPINDGDLCNMSRWQGVRWWRSTTHFVYLLGGLLFCSRCRHGVFRHDRVVRGLPSWHVVRR